MSLFKISLGAILLVSFAQPGFAKLNEAQILQAIGREVQYQQLMLGKDIPESSDLYKRIEASWRGKAEADEEIFRKDSTRVKLALDDARKVEPLVKKEIGAKDIGIKEREAIFNKWMGQYGKAPDKAQFLVEQAQHLEEASKFKTAQHRPASQKHLLGAHRRSSDADVMAGHPLPPVPAPSSSQGGSVPPAPPLPAPPAITSVGDDSVPPAPPLPGEPFAGAPPPPPPPPPPSGGHARPAGGGGLGDALAAKGKTLKKVEALTDKEKQELEKKKADENPHGALMAQILSKQKKVPEYVPSAEVSAQMAAAKKSAAGEYSDPDKVLPREVGYHPYAIKIEGKYKKDFTGVKTNRTAAQAHILKALRAAELMPLSGNPKNDEVYNKTVDIDASLSLITIQMKDLAFTHGKLISDGPWNSLKSKLEAEMEHFERLKQIVPKKGDPVGVLDDATRAQFTPEGLKAFAARIKEIQTEFETLKAAAIAAKPEESKKGTPEKAVHDAGDKGSVSEKSHRGSEGSKSRKSIGAH